MATAETVKISQVKPNPDNPRTIKDDKFAKLVQSIKDFPQMLDLRPIVVNDDMVVLGGNMRLKACKEAGLKEVPIIKASDLTPEQQKEFIIKDNVGFGEWDWDTLANEWEAEQLTEWGLDIPGFAVAGEAEEDDFDTTPPTEAQTVLGDLYELNEHRIHCADSGDSDAVAKLMNGKKANLVFTDPPYGVSFQSNMRTKTEKFDVLKNDDQFITEWIPHIELFSNGFVFVWTSWKVLKEWIEHCSIIGDLSNIVVWDKGGGGIGDLKKTFASDYEIALVYHRGNELTGKRIGFVWQVNKDGASTYQHPTQKPVELVAIALNSVTQSNSIVLDFFHGSGTTMIACEQLNRICYAQELDPCYVDVEVRRWVKYMRDNSRPFTVKLNGEDITKQEWLTA